MVYLTRTMLENQSNYYHEQILKNEKIKLGKTCD